MLSTNVYYNVWMPSFRSSFALFPVWLLLLFVLTACSGAVPPNTPSLPAAQTNTPAHPERTSTPIPSVSPSPTPTSTLVFYAPPDKTLTFKVLREYPHDSGAFTQGLVIHENILYESTGLRGRSSIRQVNLQTGRIRRIRHLPDEYFGEGMTIVDDRIIQITWQSGVGFVYDLHTFDLLETFEYPHEGWGLTFDGSLLLMSDGTEIIHLLDPDDFSETGILEVNDDGVPVTMINELEFIQGSIFANIWQTNLIAVIDPVTGNVTAWIDLSSLLSRFENIPRDVDVLNGIAYNQQTGQIFVTGKLWPKLFEIEIIQPGEFAE